jgi:hypothetical protein
MTAWVRIGPEERSGVGKYVQEDTNTCWQNLLRKRNVDGDTLLTTLTLASADTATSPAETPDLAISETLNPLLLLQMGLRARRRR